MSYPTVFANLAGGVQPASLLDTMFNIGGNQGNIACTAAGTNAITLTPNANYFLPTSYLNFQMVTFTGAATSTGPVTIQIGALGLVKLFTAAGAQASGNDVLVGGLYTAVFNAALDTGAGGFQIISTLFSPASFAKPHPGG